MGILTGKFYQNKAKCLLDALETPLSFLLIRLHHFVKLDLSRIF